MFTTTDRYIGQNTSNLSVTLNVDLGADLTNYASMKPLQLVSSRVRISLQNIVAASLSKVDMAKDT